MSIDKIQIYDPLAKNRELPRFFSCCCYAMRRSGKGVFTHWLINKIHKKHKFTSVAIFSATCKLQEYEDEWMFIPSDRKFDKFSNSKLNEIIDEHKKDVIKWKENKVGVQPNLLLIIDDLMSPTGSKEESIFYSKAVCDLYTLGRHYFISCISLLQSITSSIPTMSRKNCDLVVWFRSQNKKDLDTMINDYLMIADKSTKEAKAFLMKITEVQYTAIGVDAKLGQYAKDYSDFCFSVQAKEVKPNFMIGGTKNENKINPVKTDYGFRAKPTKKGTKLTLSFNT